MKTIINYFKVFFKEHFTGRLYLSVLIFLAVVVSVNYWLDFEDSYIDRYVGKPQRFFLYMLLHAFVYIGVLAMERLWSRNGDKSWWTNRSFWFKLLIAFILLGFDRSFSWHRELNQVISDYNVYTYLYRTIGKLSGLWTTLIPLVIVYFWLDRNEKYGLYGLRFSGVNVKPYFIMLLAMVPLLYLASLTKDFNTYYPIYAKTKGDMVAETYQVPRWVLVATFESIYSFNFLNVELFFRGFLILGFVKFLGKDAVLPMAATYCAYHFGKPMGEAISSIFGGFILGVISLNSRNIWGGVIIHAGIAMLMELFAGLQQ